MPRLAMLADDLRRSYRAFERAKKTLDKRAAKKIWYEVTKKMAGALMASASRR